MAPREVMALRATEELMLMSVRSAKMVSKTVTTRSGIF